MAGRRITKPRDKRVAEFQKACNKSGFTIQEILQLLVDWYGFRQFDIVYPGGLSPVRQSVVNSQFKEDLK